MRNKLINETLDRMTEPQKRALLRRLISYGMEVGFLPYNYEKRKIYYSSGIRSLEETIPSDQDNDLRK